MGEARERKSGDHDSVVSWACYSTRTPLPCPRQESPQRGALVSHTRKVGALTGQSVPGERHGGRAVSQGRCCLLPVLLIPASSWSPVGDTAGLRLKGPHGFQGSPPPSTGDTQGQCQSGKFPCHRLGMLLGLTPNPREHSAQHSRGCPTALGPQALWSTAHLDRAALLPALFLVSFQHLKEEQESPELNSSRVLDLGQPREVEGMPGVFAR